MAESYKIGKILGIDIELHWTFIAFLVVILLLAGISAFVVMTLLFVCVLIHELSHSFVCLQNKVRVKRIVLLPMGGASIIDQLNLPHKVEFNIAIAGPLMSLLLGAFFGFLVVFAPQGGLSQLLQLLFLINIMLGVFNILPAFPMDGGRVFRSYLERKYNSYKATMLTIRTSQVVMVLFIIATLVYVVVISASADYKEFVLLWNLLIVFFLFSGAQAEKETMEIKKRSAGMRVSEVTNSHFALVSPSDNAQKLYDTMKRTREHLLITKLGSDYAYLNLLRREKLTSGTSAGEIATKIPSIKSSASLIDALELMEMNEVGLIAVTRGKRLAGIVTLSHLQAYLSLHVPESGKEK